MKVKRISSNGITARMLIKNTPPYVKYSSESVVPVSLKRKVKNGVPSFEAVTRTSIAGEKPRKHHLRITLLEGERVSDKRSRIHVVCDCEWHCYYCEAALYRIGASDIIYSNGEIPTFTNPRMVPITCKHTLTILDVIFRKKL